MPTSGTTGPTKFIPYTRSLLAEFRRGIAPWVVDLFRHEPPLLAGTSYWAISPVAGEAEGFFDDTEYLGTAGWLARSVAAVPPTVRHLLDMDVWRRETLRHLTACQDLTLISVWNLTCLTLLLEPLREPARFWPKLRVISCGADAAAAEPAKELARQFPRVTIQPKGLIATEGFISLPWWGRDGAALAVRSHFFEFLDEAGDARLAHDLAVGREYSVVLTTSGGLQRYELHDRVRVTGFEHECPLLRFVNKDAHVSDHFGERLNECHVQSELQAIGLNAAFAMLACENNAYTLFVETTESDARLRTVAERLDTALLENIHYRYCRQLGQLAAIRVFRISERGSKTYVEACHRRGQRLGNVKHHLIDHGNGWASVFLGQFIDGRLACRPGKLETQSR